MNGLVSASNVVYNTTNPSTISSSSSFDLDSTYLTAAITNTPVEVLGYAGTNLAYDQTYSLTSSARSLINFNYLSVNKVVFSGGDCVMDNLLITPHSATNAPGGLLEFSSPTYSVPKGSPATIMVNRVGGATGVIAVQVATSDGTGSNGVNYIGFTNTLTWPNGDTNAQSVVVQTLQANGMDGNVTVNLSLFNSGGNAVISNPSNAVLTIQNVNDFGNLHFFVPNFNIPQNAGQAVITVVRTGGTCGTVSVNYAAYNGTNVTPPAQPALAGTNYGAVSGVLTFPPGVSSQTFTVPIYYTPLETNMANRVVDLVLTGSANSSNQCAKVSTLTILDPNLVPNPAGAMVPMTAESPGFNFGSYVQSLALQPNGSILAGGGFNSFEGFNAENITRILPAGDLDTNFLTNQTGANGSVCQVLNLTFGQCQTNGTILIVGNFTEVNGANWNRIARLNSNGSPDPTFDPGTGADSTVFAAAEMWLPGASTNHPGASYYVIGGAFTNFNGVPNDGVARLTHDGTLDPYFNAGLGAGGGPVYAVAVQPNNQILLGGGFTSFNGAAHHYLVRLNADGSVDTNFSAFDGVSSDIDGIIDTILVQPDSKILIGGWFTSIDGSNYNYIARLNTDGSLDASFEGGLTFNNGIYALALDSQTRILVGGAFTDVEGNCSGITRLTTNGSVDTTINFGFGVNPNAAVYSIAVQTNDEIDVGGSFSAFDRTLAYSFVQLYGGDNLSVGAIQFSQAFYGVSGNATDAIIEIQRVGNAAGFASFQFSTADGTAIEGLDYIGVTNLVTFVPGQTSAAAVIPILHDPTAQSNLTVQLDLSAPTGVSFGTQPIELLVITNNIDSSITLPALNANVVAGVGLQLQSSGAVPGASFVLQYATNLSPPVTWMPMITNKVDANGNWIFMDTNVFALPARFFRLLSTQ